MNIKLNKDELYRRELTEDEAKKINSAKAVTPMLMSPDIGRLKKTDEEVKVIHSYNTGEGLHYGIEFFEDSKYSTVHEKDIELINPKFNWVYIANQNEKR